MGLHANATTVGWHTAGASRPQPSALSLLNPHAIRSYVRKNEVRTPAAILVTLGISKAIGAFINLPYLGANPI